MLAAIPSRTRSRTLESALVALVVGASKNDGRSLAERALDVFQKDKAVAAVVTRATAPLGTTADSGFAAEISQSLVGDFLESLAPHSAAAALIAAGLSVPLGAAKEQKFPQRTGAPSTDVHWIGEGQPIPVRSYALNDDCEISPRKFGFIAALSREAARRASGERVVRRLIREDAAASLDAAYFSTDAGTDTVHAGLLNGVAPIGGYPGGDRFAIESDFAALSDAVADGGSGQVMFITSPKRAARLYIVAPDLARSLTVLPSLAVADTTIIAADPSSILHAFGDDFDLDASIEAVLHMEDETPLEIVSSTGPTAADPVRSLWQTDAVALRLLVDVAFAPRRAGAVAHVTGASW